MNDLLDREILKQLLQVRQPPCLTLYQPTHRTFPERAQDPIRYRQLLGQLEAGLRERYPEAPLEALLKPLRALEDDAQFWNHGTEALAIFAAQDYFQVLRLQRSVPERAVVNDRLDIRPLVRIAQSADRFQVLCLSRDSVRLLEGNRDALEEVTLHPDVPRDQNQALGDQLTEKGQRGMPQGYSSAGERGDPMQSEAGGSGKQAEIDLDRDRFFQRVDRAILDHHSSRSGLPLILAALPEQQGHFRRISHNPHLLPNGIETSPGALDPEQLREKAWMVLQPLYLARLQGLLDRYGAGQAKGLASDQLDDISQAMLQGRVETLLVEAERRVPGVLDKDQGQARPTPDDEPDSPDLLDEFAVWALEQGGEVISVPMERMPTRSGAAALYRF